MTDTYAYLDTHPDEIIDEAEYVPEGSGPEYVAYLREAAEFFTERGSLDIAEHYQGRLNLAEIGYTVASAQALAI